MASRKKGTKAQYPVQRDPRTGRFVSGSPSSLRKLAKLIKREYDQAVRERNQWAKKRRRGAKLPQTLDRYNRQYRQAAKKVAQLEQKVVQAQRLVPPPRQRPGSRVIEVGLNYSAAKGIASDVNINIRVSRTDGRPISIEDAKRALKAIASDEREGAENLRVSGVEWQRPARATERRAPTWRSGDPDDVWSFQAILAHVIFGGRRGESYDAFRFGEVKEDEL